MNIKSWLKNQVAAMSVALSNVEKNVLGQERTDLNDSTRQERRHLQGTLADSLMHGEITQDVRDLRWRTYKVLKASQGITLEMRSTDENGNVYYNTNNSESTNLLKKIKLDDFDSYELEMVVNNDDIVISGNDIMNNEQIKLYDNVVRNYKDDVIVSASHGEIKANDYFATSKTEKPINIERSHFPKFFIEKYTKKLNIRKINETDKLIELYINKYGDEYNKSFNLFIREIKKGIEFGIHNLNSFDIKEIEFISDNTLGSNDFLHYKYKIKSFDKIVEFDGYFIVKYIAEIVINGYDILSEYVETELDKKYDNKEKK